VAILGSCVSRDLWRMAGAPADDLLYVSRTRLPSLFGARPEGLVLPREAPPGLRPNPAQALRTDLSKSGLGALVRFRPDVVLLDYIDERFDLLAGAGGVVTASWELETSGWDALPPLMTLRRLDALGDADATLWRRSLDALARRQDAPSPWRRTSKSPPAGGRRGRRTTPGWRACTPRRGGPSLA